MTTFSILRYGFSLTILCLCPCRYVRIRLAVVPHSLPISVFAVLRFDPTPKKSTQTTVLWLSFIFFTLLHLCLSLFLLLATPLRSFEMRSCASNLIMVLAASFWEAPTDRQTELPF